jgi:hypothetical protein
VRKHSRARRNKWHDQCGIVGGMWLYDDLVGTGETPKYAKAINLGVRTKR